MSAGAASRDGAPSLGSVLRQRDPVREVVVVRVRGDDGVVTRIDGMQSIERRESLVFDVAGGGENRLHVPLDLDEFLRARDNPEDVPVFPVCDEHQLDQRVPGGPQVVVVLVHPLGGVSQPVVLLDRRE